MRDAKNALSLETEPITRLLFKYSLPSIAGMVVYSLYNIVDSIFIGHGVGALAISGLAVSFPIMNLTFAVGLLVGIGGASISSIRLGQKDTQAANNVLGNVLVLSIISGLIIALLGIFFLDPVLERFGASPDTLPYARDFMHILLLGQPITYVMSNLNQQMRSTGHPHKAMITMMVSVGVNVILAPIFIFILHWGIRGAAIATLLSQCVALAWILRHFTNKSGVLHFQPGIYRLKAPLVKSILAVGTSPFLFNACACLVVVIVNTQLSAYGGDLAIGAYGILNRILILLVMMVVGLSQGMQPIIGYNYGAQKMDRVRQTLKYGALVATAITSAGFLATQLFPHGIAMMFTDHQTLIDLSTTALRLSTIAFPIVGAQIVLSNFFQSLGKPRISIFLSLTRQLLFLIPGLLVLPRFFDLNGVWISIPVADTLATFTSLGVTVFCISKLLRADNKE